MISLTGENLSLPDVGSIAVDQEPVQVDPSALQRISRAYERVQEWGRQQQPVYGVNTGFGEMAHVMVPAQFMTTLQVNLLRGHAAGDGPPFGQPVVRAILAARLNALAKGFSGVSVPTVELLTAFLNKRIHPVIPEQGSLGASGDLAPLSHMALPLIGEGEVLVRGQRTDARVALAEHGLSPVRLGYKEGLALINGTSAMTGAAAMALLQAYSLVEVAILLSAVFTQCQRGSTRAYDARGHELKGHPGQVAVAAALRALLEGSRRTRDHAELMTVIRQRTDTASDVIDTGVYIQHAYTLRCVPQILGPVLDTLAFCRQVIEAELNSCNDNPLIFETAEASFHGGNFHGQYVAMACDFLAIALAEIGVLAERQVNRLLDPRLNRELPAFLALDASGLACGLMGAQYLATSVASENLDLAAPSSVKSLPSNGQNQDVVSMGLNAARRCLRLCHNVGGILGVLGAACLQAVHLIGVEEFSAPTREWYACLGKVGRVHDESAAIGALLQASKRFHTCREGVDLARRLVGVIDHPILAKPVL